MVQTQKEFNCFAGKTRLLFVFFVMGLLPLSGRTQNNLFFEHLTPERGLKQANIKVISSDYRGFVWMGTPDGLYRWDGVSYVIFQKDDEDSTAISSNHITSLFGEPDSSAMWVGTAFGGINRFDHATTSFKPWFLSFYDGHKKDYLTHIVAINRLNDSTLVAGTRSKGLFLVHFEGDSAITTPVHHPAMDRNLEVFRLWRHNDRMLAGTSRGFFVLSENGEVLYHTAGFLGAKGLENWFKDFLSLPSGRVVIATNNHLWYWDPESFQPQRIKLSHEITDITRLAISKEGLIWIGTRNKGLFSWNSKSKEIKHFSKSGGTLNQSLVNENINDLLFYPQQPLLMVATQGGLTTVDSERLLFQWHEVSNSGEAGDQSVRFILEDAQNSLWYWTSTGLFRKKTSAKQPVKILIPNLNNDINHVTDGWEARDGTLFFSTSNGLLKYNLRNNTREWLFFEHDDLSLSSLNRISSLYAADENILWLATEKGVVVFETASHDYKVYPFPLDEWGLQTLDVTDITLPADNKSCWIGTRNSWLIHLDIATGQYKLISTAIESTDKNPILNNHILSMEIDSTGRLWMATLGSGLLFLDEVDSTLNNRYAKSTLAGNTYAVKLGHDNNLWVSTDYGVCRLNVEKDSLNEFDRDDGIYCNGFNERSLHQTSEGRIYMGGKDGYVWFHPQKVKLNNYIPPVFITNYATGSIRVKVGGVSLPDVEPVIHNSVTIPHNRELIYFNASVLNFSNSFKNKMAWKLEGYDKKWSNATVFHTISYSNLEPGRYRLHVKGANNHGVWNHKGDYVDILISTPFYYRSWFIWLMVMGSVLLIVLALWFRTRFLQRQKRLLVKMVQRRTDKLKLANEELEASQQRVMAQKNELELHRNYLEELVVQRTSDLELAKQKAEESDHLKTAFLANLSHEIRTPMNAIVGFSSLLAIEHFSEAERHDFVKMIQSSSENLLNLINDIIDISRIETGQLVLTFGEIVVEDFLNEIVKSVTFEVDHTKQVELLLDIPPEMKHHVVVSDKHRLRQVIINLLNNALKFTTEGHVKLGVRMLSDTQKLHFLPAFPTKDFPPAAVLFYVEDTGIGIEKEDQKYIFEPFRKVENSGQMLYGGMGLGLSIVKNILAKLGGQIAIHSQPGQGSVFYFYISDMGE